MAIKRLSLKELQKECENIFYDYMVNGKKFYSGNSLSEAQFEDIPEGKTPVDMLWEETQEAIKENEMRVELFKKAIQTYQDNEELVRIHTEQLEPLLLEGELFKSSNIATQKEYFEKTGIVEYSRNRVRIPLDKLINSYYDDLILEVLFYDNLGVNAGEYETYKAIEDSAAKVNFIKKNTEVTHMGLLITGGEDSVRAIIGLKGNVSKNDNISIDVLYSKYADFDKLSLKDTLEVSNNDLKQLLQSKIDLDKEALELEATKNVRGDNYWIYSFEGKYDREYFIRYICPSTGRVYYNKLNFESLNYSEYYKKNKPETYIDAWWSLNNLGAPVEGEPIVRC